jgi:glycolate oxidase FAD binding subunit
VVDLTPAEMTVRVRAGTLVTALQAALAEEGQTVALPVLGGATVGGVLAVGRSDATRLGRGPVRDTLLEARYVSAEGEIVKAGGPTVKNVSGYDLCRLLVGSLGTLGLIAEVVLRTRPMPATSRWLSGPADPFVTRTRLYWPASVLWDGSTTWVRLEGHEADVTTQAGIARELGLSDAVGPPLLPLNRSTMPPGEIEDLARDSPGGFVAEIGVGVVHTQQRRERPAVPEGVRTLNHRVKAIFDPTGRLNPGRDPLAA